MDSALAEFSKQGYGASSINAICENTSKGIVYHYFPTKDALFLACVEECFRELTRCIQANLSREDAPPEVRLRDYFALRAAFFRNAPAYILLSRPLLLLFNRNPVIVDYGRRLLGVRGIYLSQPAADVLTILVCLCSVKSMKRTASRNMKNILTG